MKEIINKTTDAASDLTDVHSSRTSPDMEERQIKHPGQKADQSTAKEYFMANAAVHSTWSCCGDQAGSNGPPSQYISYPASRLLTPDCEGCLSENYHHFHTKE